MSGIETLGEALSLGWHVHMRCAQGRRDGNKSIRECLYRRELDLETLVCTRGAAMPLAALPERLKCPRLRLPPGVAGFRAAERLASKSWMSPGTVP